MKVAVLFGKMCLAFRGTLGFAGHRSDPRGLTGSEYGFIRISQELQKLGHQVTCFAKAAETEADGIQIRDIDERGDLAEFDAAVSINEPDLLRDTKAKVRACEFWLNGFDFVQPGFHKHVDLWLSPSQGHLETVLAEAHDICPTPNGPTELFTADPNNWHVLPLGCDPERYPVDDAVKVPGRVVYCSSPDRGLHWLLQEWPAIKRAVPHATLRIFYRLQPWIDGFQDVAYSPPIEALRSRAVYIQECLRRMRGPEWGIEVHDSVSREQIEREMSAAEVLAYPCDTTRWSEGFSCTVLEACAARACPVITDCDALGGIYRGHCEVVPRGNIAEWRQAVIDALKMPDYRAQVNKSARRFAEKLTWFEHAQKLSETLEIHARPILRLAK